VSVRTRVEDWRRDYAGVDPLELRRRVTDLESEISGIRTQLEQSRNLGEDQADWDWTTPAKTAKR